MPKVIELTVEINVERVSCPGVWLCQDGRVSLTIFALGTSYQTGMLPPLFPIEFRDVFYFRKTFEETCSLSNIVCLLKDETIYCELVQWCQDCTSWQSTILAQYLGALNDVLFPPHMCSNDGIDLLMRRSKQFPGILSPKIEITTKMRIDEVWDSVGGAQPKSAKIRACTCTRPDLDTSRQKQVCHTPLYHRVKCNTRPRSRSRSHSDGSRSCSTLFTKGQDPVFPCKATKIGLSSCPLRRRNNIADYQFQVQYRTKTPAVDNMWKAHTSTTDNSSVDYSDNDFDCRQSSSERIDQAHERLNDLKQKLILESRFIDVDKYNADLHPFGCKKKGKVKN
ncbi:spermatogenesis-associated protein 6 isoform X2 [Hyposmocoma kahamanoa]|uniref:spermatogenesis-associated protein 6 isoform X2 n=1 Tax=Hyposmocoma kahamanoa TaxID=1477025 RepID=UPI000E6D690E|nr:spermatogenesis-associated protein 6 isoform X2 [Hyposmocoma kahamanoa]